MWTALLSASLSNLGCMRHTDTHVHTHTHANLCVRMCAHAHANLYMHTCAHAHKDIHTCTSYHRHTHIKQNHSNGTPCASKHKIDNQEPVMVVLFSICLKNWCIGGNNVIFSTKLICSFSSHSHIVEACNGWVSHLYKSFIQPDNAKLCWSIERLWASVYIC